MIDDPKQLSAQVDYNEELAQDYYNRRTTDRLKAQLAERGAALASLRGALAKLVERIKFVHEDKYYKGVWSLNQMHLGSYIGPTYTEAFEEAQAILSNPAPDADLLARLAEAERERDALKAQVAEFRSDKERLDWLDTASSVLDPWLSDLHFHASANDGLREAIDAARAK